MTRIFIDNPEGRKGSGIETEHLLSVCHVSQHRIFFSFSHHILIPGKLIYPDLVENKLSKVSRIGRKFY